jgi:hypothetical protein
MVAKIIRLVFIGSVILLSACQTIAPSVDERESVIRSHEPENIVEPSQDATSAGDEIETSDEPVAIKTTPSSTKKKVETPQVKAPEPPPPSPEQVVTRLQQEALQLQSEGRWPDAELKLERALRIDAEKVDIYHQLATVRMGQERFEEAEQIALKGLTFTNQTPKFKSSLWEVIAQCRSAQGNIKGSREARAEMLKWMEYAE